MQVPPSGPGNSWLPRKSFQSSIRWKSAATPARNDIAWSRRLRSNIGGLLMILRDFRINVLGRAGSKSSNRIGRMSGKPGANRRHQIELMVMRDHIGVANALAREDGGRSPIKPRPVAYSGG